MNKLLFTIFLLVASVNAENLFDERQSWYGLKRFEHISKLPVIPVTFIGNDTRNVFYKSVARHKRFDITIDDTEFIYDDEKEELIGIALHYDSNTSINDVVDKIEKYGGIKLEKDDAGVFANVSKKTSVYVYDDCVQTIFKE